MNNLMSDTLISGRAIVSAMLTVSMLGDIGKKIISNAGIDEIDPDKWYSYKIRMNLFDQIYSRFGSEALFVIGMKTILSFPQQLKEIQQLGRIYTTTVADTNSQELLEKALEEYFQNYMSVASNIISTANKGDHDFYGVSVSKKSPTNFTIVAKTSLGEKHEAFYRATYISVLSLILLNEWKINIQFINSHYEPLLHMTTYEFEFEFEKYTGLKNPAELLADLQVNARDALLKQVVIDSDNSLMKLNEAHKELNTTHIELNSTHKLVVESVNYASRLQRGQLPRLERIDGRFSSFASIWEPRDTIGGDLYWLSSSQQSGPFVLAVADCTGHGVPGAMLSLLVSNSLERIYANDTTEDPATALMSLDHFVRTGLNQDRSDSESDDGCDAAVLRIDRDKQTIEFAGAKLGLFQVNAQGEVTRHLGSRCSLGYQDAVAEAEKPVVQKIPYQSGDVFAVVTDGFTDQIGGSTGKTSFGYRRLEDILKANCTGSAEEITAAMKLDFANWQGANSRRDDVTAVVFRL